MQELTQSLLRKVKNSILLRDAQPEVYADAFKQAEIFITATINGQLEFVPMQLLFLHYNKYQILMETKAVFGNGVEHSQLDDMLIKFYNDHDLKRDIDSISDSVKYHIKPQQNAPSTGSGLVNWSSMSQLAKYAGKAYKATDESLKTVGNEFAEYIMHPTNQWGEEVLPAGYVIERERYWQVAGYYKSFTWAKLKHKKHADKQVFFSVGIDIKASKLVFKLDCLRSGTHKLSNYDIRKFDYYTEQFNCYTGIDQDLGESVGWDKILEYSKEFIKELEPIYMGVVDYIWNGKIDLSLFKDKLFNILPENAQFSQSKPGEPVAELLYNTVLDGIIRYEQYMLAHADKDDLAALVKYSFEEITQIESFEFDGQHKHIYVVVSTGSPFTPFEVSEELRQRLEENDHTYIYQVYDYDEATNCGKMVVRRGDPKQYAKLESVLYSAIIK
ncbi:MAG: hypothetical protein ABFS32_15575 [Bacteroidota bacterium]